MKSTEYWPLDMAHAVIQPVGQHAEGYDVINAIKTLVDKIGYDSVLDFGCGNGRLSIAFDPQRYIGVDINGRAIDAARRENPSYAYLGEISNLSADLVFCYTSLLHLDDDEILEWVSRLDCNKLIIAEMMGRDWRRNGLPPVYNREPGEYVEMIEALTPLRLVRQMKLPHEHYAGRDKRLTSVIVQVYGVDDAIADVL